MTSKDSKLDQARLKELLHYNRATGRFTRKVAACNRVKIGSEAGYLRPDGYVQLYVGSNRHYAHCVAWLYMTGEWPPEKIDHINGVRDDNRFDNLRAVSHQDNARNQKIPITNSSGVMGVSWHKRIKKWNAYIRVDGKLIHIGYFDNLCDASVARKQAEIEHGFHENHGRSQADALTNSEL